MASMHRRHFLALTAAAGLASARTLKTIGVQLYTVRGVLGDKTLETLRAIEAAGYREAEVVAGSIPQIWDALKQTKLRPVSVHLDTQLFTANQDKLQAALDDSKKRGFDYVVCPYIAPKDRGGVDMIRKLGDTLNKAGETCRKAGLRLCYHNHAFEFAAAGDGPDTLLDVLLKTADPKLVGLELDIMWSQVAGFDPVSVINKYGKRVELLHLKNVAKDVGQRFDERVPRTAFKEVGEGSIDIPAVLRAAQKAGTKHFFVEQDQTPGDPVASLRHSYEYLAKLNY